MKFSEWIKIQIDSLRAMLVTDDPPAVPPEGVDQIEVEKGIVLRFVSSPANLSRVRKAIEKFSERTQLDAQARDEVGLVVNEALANVIRHAYRSEKDKPIELKAEIFQGGLKVQIRDWGTGVDPTHRPRPTHDPLVPGGLGLMCMKHLMDDMQFIPQTDGMLLEMSRTTPGSKAASFELRKGNGAIENGG
jgi:serine/threonine-protein kinase RsbW